MGPKSGHFCSQLEPGDQAEPPSQQQIAGKVDEEAQEANETDGLSLSDQAVEETGGLVLLEEPAESWRWYDYRDCYGVEPSPATEPGLSADPERRSPVTKQA